MTVLVVNHAHTTVCGIHDLGRRVYDRLVAVDPGVGYIDADGSAWLPAADVTLFNYRADLMPWVAPMLPKIAGVKAAILHNYDTDTCYRRSLELLDVGFDRVVVLEQPGATSLDPRVIPAGRLLPERADDVIPPMEELRVGSFGFAFPHKRFDLVADLARQLALPAGSVVYRLHTPEAYFNGAAGASLYAPGIHDACTAFLPESMFEHSTDHRSDAEVVEWLAGNHVNCLLYTPGQPDAGLSSALDFLIAARRPIVVSDAAMFRHGGDAVARWPEHGLWEVVREMPAWTRRVTELADRYDATAAVDLLKGLAA